MGHACWGFDSPKLITLVRKLINAPPSSWACFFFNPLAACDKRWPKASIMHKIKSTLASPLVHTSLRHQTEIQILWGEVRATRRERVTRLIFPRVGYTPKGRQSLRYSREGSTPTLKLMQHIVGQPNVKLGQTILFVRFPFVQEA